MLRTFIFTHRTQPLQNNKFDHDFSHKRNTNSGSLDPIMEEKAEGIRIYLRLRPPASQQHSSLLGKFSNTACEYQVENRFGSSTITFRAADRRTDDDIVNNTTQNYTFNFRRIFDPSATQEDVFNSVAKDCISSVLSGYNSTIFAYGQTGSGKTYSITGGTESYAERGIIPRALAMIYDQIAQRNDCTWSLGITYLQVYNDKGQDLLNHGKDARALEDLPSVTVHEGEEDVVLRGLGQHAAPSLSDSLNLLFLGDTNRLYCETPMNRTSSRSHCVFTVHVEARVVGDSVVRRSKLNLVDLAGSERVSKTGVKGTILTEAKYINLSLHYLEHVIIALSEQAKGKRDHIPYRNSFLTMVLRDSLGGNCRTSMLATAHLSQALLPETLSTCSFSQRVALIKQDARVNTETDPVLLVRMLKSEIVKLRDQLSFHEKGAGGRADRDLSDEEMLICRGLVDKYLYATDPPQTRIEGFEGDLAYLFYCMTLMREIITTGKGPGLSSTATHYRDAAGASLPATEAALLVDNVQALQVSLQQKENELSMMMNLLQKTQGARYNAATQTSPSEAVREWSPTGVPPSSCNQASNGAYTSPLVPHAPSAEAAISITRVNRLAESGKLSAAQATAAEEYILHKDTLLQKPYGLPALSDASLVENRAAAFESFKSSYQNYAKVEATKAELQGRYDRCKSTAQELNGAIDAIKQLKLQVQRLRAERAVDGIEVEDAEERRLLDQLGALRQVHNGLAVSLREQKEEIDGIHLFMKRSQEQVTRDFETWFASRKKQIALAVTQKASDNLSSSADVVQPMWGTSANEGSGSPRQSCGKTTDSLPPPPSPTQSSSLFELSRGSAAASKVASPNTFASVTITEKHPFSAPTHSLAISCPAGPQQRGNGETPGSVSAPLSSSVMLSNTRLDMAGGTGARVNPSPSGWVAVGDGVPNTPAPHSLNSSRSNLLLGGPATSRPHHLHPLPTDGEGGGSLGGSSAAALTTPNPFAPRQRSTGDSAADKQLAELYKAREAMRQELLQ